MSRAKCFVLVHVLACTYLLLSYRHLKQYVRSIKTSPDYYMLTETKNPNFKSGSKNRSRSAGEDRVSKQFLRVHYGLYCHRYTSRLEEGMI